MEGIVATKFGESHDCSSYEVNERWRVGSVTGENDKVVNVEYSKFGSVES